MRGKERVRINLHHKITLISAFTVALILAGIYLYLNQNLKGYTYQRIKTNLSKEASFAGVYLERVFDQSVPQKEMDDIAGRIGKSLDSRATIIGLDGSVLGDSELEREELSRAGNYLWRPEIQDALKDGLGESRRFSATVQKDMLYAARRFGAGGAQGFVRLSVPLSEIAAISDHLKRLLLVCLLLAFFAAGAISLTAFIFVSKPIKEISSVAQEIAGGNYVKRLSFAREDEIGDLAKAVNYMSEQIKARVEDVVSNKSKLEAVLMSMCEGTMVVDKKGVILLMNRTSREFFHAQEDPVGRRPLEVIRNIEIQEIADKVLQSKERVTSQEITILAPNEKTLQIYAAPVLRGEEMDGAVLVFHDITELRRLERIRRDFVANVSHEIRTPLTSIKGYAETLLDGAIEDKRHAKEFLQIIGSDSNRLVQLVDDLLDLSRVESGQPDLKFSPRPIESIVDRVILGLKKQARNRKITLKKDIPENVSAVNVDEAGIAQVLLNLLDNGIKYNKEGGSVTISAQDGNGFVRVDISDTGIGIPEEDLPRIFERFYRVDKARSRELGGTGLGLSIVKHIVQAHKGEVSVRSELGRGTTFSFTLPKA